MKKVIIDTNFLMIPCQFKVDIFSEIERVCAFDHEVLIVDKTIDELKGIEASGKGKDSLAAKLALQLLKHHLIMQLRTKKDRSVDDLIVSIADKDTIVATQDAELKKRVKKKKAGLIVMRQKKYLVLM